MRRNIRPAEEELRGAASLFGFLVVWYLGLFSVIGSRGFSAEISIFLLGGLFVLYQAVQSIRRAFFYRRQRKEAIQYGDAKRGRIVGILRENVPREVSSRGNRIQRYYYLDIEISGFPNGGVRRIRSQGYSKPVYRYLRSPNVTVYMDRSGWKYYVEDFDWKESRHDPDAFITQPEFQESGTVMRIFEALFILAMIWMLLSSFLK